RFSADRKTAHSSSTRSASACSTCSPAPKASSTRPPSRASSPITNPPSASIRAQRAAAASMLAASPSIRWCSTARPEKPTSAAGRAVQGGGRRFGSRRDRDGQIRYDMLKVTPAEGARSKAMSLAEVLPDVQSLSRLDKIRLIQLLAQGLEQDES